MIPATAFTIALIGGQIPSPWEVTGVALVIAALMLNSFGGGRTVPAAPGRAAG